LHNSNERTEQASFVRVWMVDGQISPSRSNELWREFAPLGANSLEPICVWNIPHSKHLAESGMGGLNVYDPLIDVEIVK
jgi:hypothetical protein